jgi:hypothetical protein
MSCMVVWAVVRKILTFSYAGALNHYTIQPLERIRLQQQDVAEVAVLLADFREMKQQELSFVNQGVRLRLTGCSLPLLSAVLYHRQAPRDLDTFKISIETPH